MHETDNPFRDIPDRVSIFMYLDSEGVQHKGQDSKIKCPFRDEKTPSFSIYKNGHKWKDHVTGNHGDVIDLYMEMNPGAEKKDALAHLARIGGMILKTQDPNDLPTPGGRYRSQLRPQELRDPVRPEDRSLLAAEIVNRSREGVPHELLCGRKGLSVESLRVFAMEGSIGMGLDRALLTRLGASDAIQERGCDRGSLAYIMGRGVKVRPKAETSHNDHWIVGKGSENIFRGEALLAAQEHNDCKLKVIITEGEADCMVLQEELWNRDMHRTFVLGAHGGSWVPDFRIARRYLRGREVFVVGDRDKAGDDFADRLVAHLREVAGVSSAYAYRWPLQEWRDSNVGDIGEAREKNLMEKFISSLRCKEAWM